MDQESVRQITFWLAVSGAIVSLYGAALSTFNYFHARKKDIRQLNIKLGWTMRVQVPDGKNTPVPNLSALVVSVVNMGLRPIQLSDIALFHHSEQIDSHSEGTGSRPDWENTKLPVKLGEGEEAKFFFFSHWASQMLRPKHKNSLVPLAVIATLSTGEKFRSRVELFDVESGMFPHLGKSKLAASRF